MVKCRDILQMNLDGMWLLAGDFALCSVDFEHFGWKEVSDAMRELDELKISGFAISIKDEREEVPEDVIELAEKLTLPLFKIRWEKASFVDIAQSIGNYVIEENNKTNRKGEFFE